MKKLIYILIPTVLLLFTCDKSPTEPAEPTFSGSFDDPDFENLIRRTLDKRTGKLTQSDLNEIEKIDGDYNLLSNINGIKYCKNLKTLSLKGNDLYYPKDFYQNIVSGVKEIEELKKLEYLDLSSNNIRDISFLKKLTNLKFLGLENTHISKIYALSDLHQLEELRLSTDGHRLEGYSRLHNLENLKTLYLKGLSYSYELFNYISQASNLNSLSFEKCSIRNIAFIEDLTSLERLNLSFNYVKDISRLKDFTNLSVLYLNDNSITDLKPLVDNTNFRKDDNIEPYLLITNNPLSEQSINEYIPVLEARGVQVYY